MIFIKKKDIFLLEEIVKKNFSSKYKDSVLGILWTILKPLFLMIVFTIVFSTLFNRDIVNYPVYFLCGWCLFQFFTSAITVSMNALKGNKNILKRTPAPKYIFILGSIISEFINLLIMFVLLIFIMIITRAPIYWSLLPVSLIPLISLIIMITGLGLMLSVFCVFYSDIQHLWGVLSMVLMYASAIFYPMETVPQPYYNYLILNPIFWVIDQFRCFIYYGTFPQIIHMANLVLLSLIILIVGIITFKKYENIVAVKF